MQASIELEQQDIYHTVPWRRGGLTMQAAANQLEDALDDNV